MDGSRPWLNILCKAFGRNATSSSRHASSQAAVNDAAVVAAAAKTKERTTCDTRFVSAADKRPWERRKAPYSNAGDVGISQV